MEQARIRSVAESLVRMGEELLGITEAKKVKEESPEDEAVEDTKGEEIDPGETKKPDMKKRVLMMAFINKAKKKKQQD